MPKKKHLPYYNSNYKKESLLTKDLINQIAKLYRSGLKDSTVANIVGISPITLREWLLKGAAGSANELLVELFEKCASAVGILELEFVNEIRKYALGSPAEYAYDEIKHSDGTITKVISKNSDGDPIIIKSEIKPNPQWAAWILERRFRETWGVREPIVEVAYTPDGVANDAGFNKNNGEVVNVPAPVHMSSEEKLYMVEKYTELLKRKQKTEEVEVASHEDFDS